MRKAMEAILDNEFHLYLTKFLSISGERSVSYGKPSGAKLLLVKEN